MTKRLPVSTLENVFHNSQQVTSEDLSTEQQHNDQGIQGIVQNHFGSGVIPTSGIQNELFNSDSVVGLLDGKPISITTQPSDTLLGNQLEIELVNSSVFGRRGVKVAIIGLDFQENVQYETFVFSRNEKQIGHRHFTKILSILFNDLRGTSQQSFNLGGTVHIREAKPFTLSRDTIATAQNSEPNLFFRDFYVDQSYPTLQAMLVAALGTYSIDNLDVSTSYKQTRKLLANDTASQIGEKFIATTNNIQKISLLLSVENTVTPADLAWTGDLVCSIYALQSTVSCVTDITPSLAINFPPSNLPLAQTSYNYTTLAANGITLDGYLQPVDFVFSNTPVATGALVPGQFYCVSIKRSGSADKCNIITAIGNDTVENAQETLFNGTTWVDVPTEDVWFEAWTDAAKVTDGQGYDAGSGMILPKTGTDTVTNAEIDYCLSKVSFTTTNPFTAVMSAVTQQSVTVQDGQTGEPVFSRQQTVPSLSLLGTADYATLTARSEPVTIGTIQDFNIKAFDASNQTLVGQFNHFGFYQNKVVIKVIDGYDGYVGPVHLPENLNIVTALLNGSLTEAKFIPDVVSAPNTYYRIGKAELLTMIYGDINNDGVVDGTDLTLVQTLLGRTLVTSPTLANYTTNTSKFVTETGVTFNLMNGATVVGSGTGVITVNPIDGTYATFSSTSVNFNSVSNILNDTVVVTSSANQANIGTFFITALLDNTDITINKFYENDNAIEQILRADINNSFSVDTTDITLISNYVLGVQPIPAASIPANLVGTPFRVIVLTLEEFSDRNDNYPSNVSNRNATIHPVVDVFSSDSVLANHNFIASPITFNVVKRFVWENALVQAISNVRYVPSSLTSLTNVAPPSLSLAGAVSQQYPVLTPPDPGRNDLYVNDNIVLGKQLLSSTGGYYKVDYEVGTVTLEVPVKLFPSEKNINVFTDLVADFYGNGKTRLGYPAMRFADMSVIKNPDGLINNQVRFAVAIQSLYGLLDGYTVSTSAFVHEQNGVSIDATSGIITLNFKDLLQDPILQTLNTKVIVTVYLKKAGFNNNSLYVDSNKLANILGL